MILAAARLAEEQFGSGVKTSESFGTRLQLEGAGLEGQSYVRETVQPVGEFVLVRQRVGAEGVDVQPGWNFVVSETLPLVVEVGVAHEDGPLAPSVRTKFRTV